MKKILILISLGLIGCKSIKKDKQLLVTNSEKTELLTQDSTNTSRVDSSSFLNKNISQTNTEEIIQTIEETEKVITVNNIEVTVPIKRTTTTIKKEGVILENITKEIKFQHVDSINTSKKTVNSSVENLEQLDLKKESEGIEIFKEIISGIIDGTLGIGKYFILFILIIILILVARKLFNNKKNKNEQTI